MDTAREDARSWEGRRDPKYLADVQTTFHQFKVIEGNDSVVINTRAEYEDDETGSSKVASCDIHDFVDGNLAAITSYTVEMHESSA